MWFQRNTFRFQILIYSTIKSYLFHYFITVIELICITQLSKSNSILPKYLSSRINWWNVLNWLCVFIFVSFNQWCCESSLPKKNGWIWNDYRISRALRMLFAPSLSPLFLNYFLSIPYRCLGKFVYPKWMKSSNHIVAPYLQR